MPTTSRPKPRERLLAAAEELFYREGVHLGVDRLCEVAGVSKRSMYQHFGGKDDVVVAALDRRAAVLAERWSVDPTATPRDRILGVFDALQGEARSPDFHGCPFVNVATELKDGDHPAAVAARGHKLELTALFGTWAEQAGARDAAGLAEQLTMVFDGACAFAVVRGEVPVAARGAAEALLAAQGI